MTHQSFKESSSYDLIDPDSYWDSSIPLPDVPEVPNSISIDDENMMLNIMNVHDLLPSQSNPSMDSCTFSDDISRLEPAQKDNALREATTDDIVNAILGADANAMNKSEGEELILLLKDIKKSTPSMSFKPNSFGDMKIKHEFSDDTPDNDYTTYRNSKGKLHLVQKAEEAKVDNVLAHSILHNNSDFCKNHFTVAKILREKLENDDLQIRERANSNTSTLESLFLIHKQYRDISESSIVAARAEINLRFESERISLKKAVAAVVEDLKGEISPKTTSGQGYVETAQAKMILRNWYDNNRTFPYPTDEEKISLCNLTGLSSLKLSNWFNNRRSRDRRKMEPVEVPLKLDNEENNIIRRRLHARAARGAHHARKMRLLQIENTQKEKK